MFPSKIPIDPITDQDRKNRGQKIQDRQHQACMWIQNFIQSSFEEHQ